MYTDGDVEDIAVVEVDKLGQGIVKESLKGQLQTAVEDPVLFSGTCVEMNKDLCPVLQQNVLEYKSVQQVEFAENECKVVQREAFD